MKKIFITMMILFTTVLLFANDEPYGLNPQSGEIFPIKSDAIQMLSEIVIFSNNQFSTVFYFTNTTDVEQKITMGFPIIWDRQEDVLGYGIEAYYDYPKQKILKMALKEIEKRFNFKTTVNGKSAKRRMRTGRKKDDFDYVFYFDTVFKPNELICISNKYNQEPIIDHFNGSAVCGPITKLYYYLKSGANWKDNLEKSDIYFYIPKRSYLKGITHQYYSGFECGYRMHFQPKKVKRSENNKYFILH